MVWFHPYQARVSTIDYVAERETVHGTPEIAKQTYLQEEASKALGCLLVRRSSFDAHRRKQVSYFEMALHQIKTSQKPLRPLKRPRLSAPVPSGKLRPTILISEAEAQHATCIKEAKANCASIIAEAESCCSIAITKVESHGAKQSHAKGMQHLETEAIEEEGKDHLSFLTTCGAALQAQPS